MARSPSRGAASIRVLRIDESPPVTDVHIVAASIDVPSSGVGEPGLPPFAPALCNAIFAARASVSGACRSATSWLLENDFRGRGIASTPAASTQADQVVIELGCEIFGARNVGSQIFPLQVMNGRVE